ncbi:MAG: hypothetical protein KF819_35130, partial [Labilithrix sp.]|nr:hypothetical protein [Labilithrix sp.]
MKLRVALVALLGALAASTPSPARASLTTSEKAQIKDFVTSARPENANRVRSLVARTDLTTEESIAALSDAVSPAPFIDARGVFLREIVFGVSSAASRPLLAQVVVRAMLARADAIFQKYVGGLDHEPRAIAELVSIYAFLDGAIANAGRPTLAAHDPNAGISAATYEECSKAMREHVDRNARWLKGDGVMPESVGRVRAQAQTALFDMLPDGLTRRVDAADRLGLKGARRQILTDWGILLADAGKLDEDKAEKVRQVLVRLPGARVDLELIYAGEDRGPLRTRGLVAFVGGASRDAAADAKPFGDEVGALTVDTSVSLITEDLAVLAVKRGLDVRPELRAQADRDATAANDEAKILGRPRAPSVEHEVAAAAHLLLLDAPRTIDLAFVRLLGGRPESAALLSDAIGALAAFAPPPKAAGQGPELALSKTMTGVRLAPNGTAIGFTLDGHAWALERPAPGFAVANVTRGGQPLSLAHLPTAKTPLREGTTWSDGTISFAKLRGAPRAAIVPPAEKAEKGAGPTVKLLGSAAKGYDAIGTAAPAEDFVLEGDLVVRGAPGGIAFRATNARESVRGAMLVVTPGGRTALVTTDDGGAEAMLAAPIDPSPAGPVRVKISVKGAKVEAVVGPTTLTGTLPASLAKGEIALVAKKGANV